MLRGVIPVIFSAAALILCYPKFNLGFLAWVALSPFFGAIIKSKNAKTAFLFGILFGFVFYLGFLYWIAFTVNAGGAKPPSSIGILCALSLILSVEFGVYSFLARIFIRAKNLFPFACALLWVIFEWSRYFIAEKLIWFPWFTLYQSQWQYEKIIQISSVFSSEFISFAICFACASIGYYIWGKKVSTKILVPPFVLFLAVFGFGFLRLHNKPILKLADGIKISILQPNIDQYKKGNSAYNEYILSVYRRQVEAAEKFKPDLIIWPESSVDFADTAQDIAQQTGLSLPVKTYHILGGLSENSGGEFVSAFLLSPQGIEQTYNKRILVPFGEYTPFRKFFQSLTTEFGQFPDSKRGEINQTPMPAGKIRAGGLICYEALFPSLSRRNANAGANLLVNITNDGWYLDTAGPYQHFTANIFRAVENGRYLVRSASTGISAVIDNYGRVVEQTKIGEPAVINFTLPAELPESKTLYSRCGNCFAALCLVFLAVFYLREILSN